MNEVWLVILPLIAGYLLDLAFGDPRTIPHPVVGFGNMISWAERHFNCGRFRKWKGAVVALSFPLFVGMIGWGITVGTLAVGDWCFCIVIGFLPVINFLLILCISILRFLVA